MYLTNVKTACMEAVEILEIPGLFTPSRIDRAAVPKGMYAYDMQTSEDDWSQPRRIARRITTAYFGTVLTASPIELPESGFRDLSFGDFTQNSGGEQLTVEEFECKYLAPDPNVRARDIDHSHIR